MAEGVVIFQLVSLPGAWAGEGEINEVNLQKVFEFICVFDLLDLVTVKIVGSGSFSGLLVVKYDFLLKIDCIRS